MLTQRELKRLLIYDPETGEFTRARGKFRGRIAGSVRYHSKAAPNYLRIYIYVGGQRYPAHRLAWLYMTGAWPLGVVDHKDRNALNNKWENLRDVSQAVNCNNLGIQKNNSTGFRGVTRHPYGFLARKNIDGKRAGKVFKTAKEAAGWLSW